MLRQGQIETLLAQAKYSTDVLSHQPTGSGKTLSMLIPMVNAYLETLAGSGPGCSLPALGLIVVPWRSLCFDLEREANEFFKWVDPTWAPIDSTTVGLDQYFHLGAGTSPYPHYLASLDRYRIICNSGHNNSILCNKSIRRCWL